MDEVDERNHVFEVFTRTDKIHACGKSWFSCIAFYTLVLIHWQTHGIKHVLNWGNRLEDLEMKMKSLNMFWARIKLIQYSKKAQQMFYAW